MASLLDTENLDMTAEEWIIRKEDKLDNVDKKNGDASQVASQDSQDFEYNSCDDTKARHTMHYNYDTTYDYYNNEATDKDDTTEEQRTDNGADVLNQSYDE